MSKKLFTTLILTCLSVTLLATEETAQPAPFTSFAGKIIGSKVRMRTKPTPESHVVCETRNGQLFAVTGEVQDYYAIQPQKGMKGYIFRTFILDGVVEGDRVNVRLHPDIEAPVVAQLQRGDRVETVVSEANNKWLELDLPSTSNFFIAKEYIEKMGPVEMVATMEQRHHEAVHHLSSAFLVAQAQIQKPFEQIDFDTISSKLNDIAAQYHDLSDIAEQAREANAIMQDIYVQKKIAFLESKTQNSQVCMAIDPAHLDRLAKLGIDIPKVHHEKNVMEIGEAASNTLGLASTVQTDEVTDKMLVWAPLEESVFHLWIATNGDRPQTDFYQEEERKATILTGIIESYNRPVKNRPGDYILKSENLPVAFLYSTRVDLEKLVGKRVTAIASPRPNNNFAFPAYYVLSVE